MLEKEDGYVNKQVNPFIVCNFVKEKNWMLGERISL